MNFAYIVSKETSSWIPKLGKNKRTILLICDDYCNFFCKWARCRRNPFFVGMIWEIRRSFVCRKEKILWRISFITESGIYSRSCDKRVVFISEMSYSLYFSFLSRRQSAAVQELTLTSRTSTSLPLVLDIDRMLNDLGKYLQYSLWS